ncbi:flagellar basal body-associated FliL family protein [Agarilytica rhodophyticola]|uniref:flagellar basal body-associated FliL family protein n=1 Tax=Agarilytica rhodophyticola TaxID=1737490 RepID=UPI000B345F50|nr:flagellar basal body-associated FliL family protein [Agarilytica rhodophyticola]
MLKSILWPLWCRLCIALFLCFQSVYLYAEEEAAEGEENAPPPAIYLPLKPPFVVNYGGAGRLRYIKTEVSVRVANIDTGNAVRFHMPFIRNNMVMLFSSQTSETVSSQEGREKIRMDALEQIRDVLEAENKTPREDVIEVFFNSFIVQK